MGRLYLLMTEVTNAHCTPQKLTENMDSVRTWRKSTISYEQTCTFCFLSDCLYLSHSLPFSHTYTQYNTHTHTHNSFQPKHPWGRTSGCWKCQTALSRPISVREPNHCVWRVGMCVCSAKTTNPKASSCVSLGYQLSLKEWLEFAFVTKLILYWV